MEIDQGAFSWQYPQNSPCEDLTHGELLHHLVWRHKRCQAGTDKIIGVGMNQYIHT
jgi:hypothetical protein